MIKINLLPYRDIQKKEKTLSQFVLMIAGLILSIIIVLVVHFKVISIEASLVKEKEDLGREITELDAKLGQIDKTKAQKAEIERKLGVIDKLNQNRTQATNLMYRIAEATPEKVWLVALKESEKEVNVDGEAMTANDVSEYMERLGKAGLFQKVNLITLDQSTRSDKKIIKFTLNLLKV